MKIIKKLLLKLIGKYKKIESLDLLFTGREIMYNHFKHKFGKDCKISITITDANKYDDLLNDCTLVYDKEGKTYHYIHFKKD